MYSASAMALSIASLVPEPTEKCAVAAASPSSTMLPCDQRSHSTRLKLSQAEPRRWRALRHQAMAAEVSGEDALAGCNRLVLAHAIEPDAPPGRLRAFDDEGRGVGIELVGVHPDPAVLRLLEDECEGVIELLMRAEPDVLALAHVDIGLEDIRESMLRTLELAPSAANDQIEAR